MYSSPVTVGSPATAQQYNKLREDARGASYLLAHESTTPNMNVSIESGYFYDNTGAKVSFAGGVAMINAVGANPRIDLISISPSGVLTKTEGTAGPSPVEPSLPSNHAPVAFIYLRVGGTSVKSIDDTVNHYIVDARTYITAPSQLISSSDSIPEGTTNLYFTNGRALSAVASALGLKADDSAVLHKTGNETASGNKTLSGITVLGSDTATDYPLELKGQFDTGMKLYAGGVLQGVLVANTSLGIILASSVSNKDIDLMTEGTGKVKYNGTEIAKRAANTFTGTQTLSGTGKLLVIGDDSSIHDVNLSNTARWSGEQDSTQMTLLLGTGGAYIKGNTNGSLELGGYGGTGYKQTAVLAENISGAGYSSDVTNNFATTGSNSGTYTVMGGRVQFGTRTKIVSVTYPHNASNASAAIIIQDDTGAQLGSYAVTSGTKIATCNFICEPGVIYRIGCNSTANFSGLHANYTLTANDVANGFISAIYNGGNFDTTWRLQQIVTQNEVTSNVPVAIVGAVNYPQVAGTSAAGNYTNLGIRFSVPYACTLGTVAYWTTAATAGSFILQNDSGTALSTQAVGVGVSSATFNYALSANTTYRLVVGSTGNFSNVAYYNTVAGNQGYFPYTVSGTNNGVTDNTNAWQFGSIQLDFGNKAYKARANRGMEKAFAKFAGFVQGPLTAGVNVTVNNNDGSYGGSFSGLTKDAYYWVGNVAGTISSTPGVYPSFVGQAASATEIYILRDVPVKQLGTYTSVGLSSGAYSNLQYSGATGFIKQPCIAKLSVYTLNATAGIEVSTDGVTWSTFYTQSAYGVTTEYWFLLDAGRSYRCWTNIGGGGSVGANSYIYYFV